VEPLLKHFWPRAPKEHVRAIHRVIELAEQSAATAPARTARAAAARTVRADAARAADAAVAARVVSAVRAARAANEAVVAADAATARSIRATAAIPARAADAAAEAVAAARTLASEPTAAAIRRDFDLLLTLSRGGNWNDQTPVRPAVFGPLWPEGPPPGWPSEDMRLVIQATLTGDVPAETVTQDLLDLYKAVNDYHIARGGTGLKLEDFRRLVRSVVGAEV
jgi:hypothetical protein